MPAAGILLALAVVWFRWPPVRENPALGAVTVVRDIRYHPAGRLDVLQPAEDGQRPVVVMLHGCCGGREDLFQVGYELAARGVLVFNVGWRTIPSGGTYPEVYEQAACAVRFARYEAHNYGGDPSRVSLLGWSDGAMLAATAALAVTEHQGSCAYPGSGTPDLLIGVSGFYGWDADRLPADGGGIIAFFGDTGTATAEAATTDAWIEGNPYSHIGADTTRPALLISGDRDALVANAACFHQELLEAGHPSRLRVIIDAGHLDLISPRTRPGRVVVEDVVSAVMTEDIDPALGDFFFCQ